MDESECFIKQQFLYITPLYRFVPGRTHERRDAAEKK